MTQVGDGKWCKRKDRGEKREEITASVKGTAGGGFVVVTERSDAATRYQSIADVMGPVLRGCDVATRHRHQNVGSLVNVIVPHELVTRPLFF